MKPPPVPVIEPAMRRIVIAHVPTGVVGEAGMSIHYEGFPEGWGLVVEVLLKAVSEAVYQAVLAERKKHQAGVPHLLVPGTGERL